MFDDVWVWWLHLQTGLENLGNTYRASDQSIKVHALGIHILHISLIFLRDLGMPFLWRRLRNTAWYIWRLKHDTSGTVREKHERTLYLNFGKVSIAQFISHHSQHWFKKKTTVMYPNVHPGWANPGLINSGYIPNWWFHLLLKWQPPRGKRSSDPGQTVNDSSWKRHMRHSASTHGSKIIP
jgi:hypothetical protein